MNIKPCSIRIVVLICLIALSVIPNYTFAAPSVVELSKQVGILQKQLDALQKQVQILFATPATALALQTATPTPTGTNTIVLSNVPMQIKNDDTTMSTSSNLLWGRHSPKYVRNNGYRYALLQQHPAHPRDISLYRFDEAQPTLGWKLAWKKGISDAHQPASLLVQKNGTLHIIYPKNNVGEVMHIVIDKPQASTMSVRTIPTTVWGKDNYYFGAAIDSVNDTIFLCSNQWAGNILRCGWYEGGVWNVKNSMSFAGNQYLYPSIEPIGNDSFWIATDAYKLGAHNADRNLSFAGKLSKQDGRFTVTPGSVWTVANTAKSGIAYFANDVTTNGAGGTFVLESGTRNSIDKGVYLLELSTGSFKKILVAGLAGAQYNLAYINGTIHIVGGGTHMQSTDRGQTWTTSTYYQTAYPLSAYAYNHAHTLKERSGSIMKSGSLLFLQEIRNRATNEMSVIEIEIPV